VLHAVEIAFFADLYGMTDEQVMRELMAAGLDSLPGGGAEVFASRVRRKICATSAAPTWLPSIAPPMARMRSNVTMLYGTSRRTKSASITCWRAGPADETGASRPSSRSASTPTQQMHKLPPAASETLRVHAVARLMLAMWRT